MGSRHIYLPFSWNTIFIPPLLSTLILMCYHFLPLYSCLYLSQLHPALILWKL